MESASLSDSERSLQKHEIITQEINKENKSDAEATKVISHIVQYLEQEGLSGFSARMVLGYIQVQASKSTASITNLLHFLLSRYFI